MGALYFVLMYSNRVFFYVVFIFLLFTLIFYYIVTVAEGCYCNRAHIYRYIVQQGTKTKSTITYKSHP